MDALFNTTITLGMTVNGLLVYMPRLFATHNKFAFRYWQADLKVAALESERPVPVNQNSRRFSRSVRDIYVHQSHKLPSMAEARWFPLQGQRALLA